MRRAMLLAAAVAAAALSSSGAAGPRPPLIITEAESGTKLVVTRPRQVLLRLDHRWRWTSPRTTGRAVRLTRVRYETDPGFDEWYVRLVDEGRATVNAFGEPNCRACDRRARRFSITVVVR